MILAGDVGGTKTRIGLFEEENGQLIKQHFEQFESKKHAQLSDIIKQFMTTNKVSAQMACFGVPGPVVDGLVNITNLPWKLSERDLERDCNITRVKLVNDLVATAAAIPSFAEKDIHTLYAGTPKESHSVYAVVAPGTGLGQALMHRENGKYYYLASEGGHASFAPTNEEEIELLQYLQKKFEVVSVERVLCGPGIANIYSFLRDSGFAKELPEVAERMKSEDPAVVISKSAVANTCALSVKTLDMFASMLGSHAGNMMLTFMANGGVYLGGGIPPKVIAKLTEGSTVKAYLNKGKLRHQVEATPLHIIKDDHAALHGAANIAKTLVI